MNKRLVLLFSSLFLIAGCSKSTKKTLGLIETMPDEYKVKRNKSLEVPPSYQQKKLKMNKRNSKFSEAERALLEDTK